MNRCAAILGIGTPRSNVSVAGDVLYTTWEDHSSSIWVIIQNEMDHKIHVEKICLIFYDRKGKPIKEKQEEPQENCNLKPHQTLQFGPFEQLSNSHIARVRYIKYSVE
jgi:hypothetical protein